MPQAVTHGKLCQLLSVLGGYVLLNETLYLERKYLILYEMAIWFEMLVS